MATGKFVMQGQVSQDLLATLAGNSLYKTQLYELLGRVSNCNYKTQLLLGMVPGAPLYEKIRTDVRNNANDNTALPAATRVFFNTLPTTVGVSTTNYPASALVTIGGPSGSLVTAHSTKAKAWTFAANVFTITAVKQFMVKVQATVALYNGTNAITGNHPAPVFTSPTEADHNVNVILDLEGTTNGTSWEVLASVTGVLRHAQIVAKTPITLSLSKMVVGGPGEYTKLRLNLTRSAKVCTFGGIDDRIGFVKVGTPSAAAKDTSNYIDLVEIS